MRPYETGATYVNFLGFDGATPERVRAAYAPEDWERLVELKDRYDPENLFRFNRNIPPSSARVRGSKEPLTPHGRRWHRRLVLRPLGSFSSGPCAIAAPYSPEMGFKGPLGSQEHLQGLPGQGESLPRPGRSGTKIC